LGVRFTSEGLLLTTKAASLFERVQKSPPLLLRKTEKVSAEQKKFIIFIIHRLTL
jgi:hypothetical protein